MHLYIHVPFCVRRCSYCDFSIAVRKTIPAREYVAAVLSELHSADPGPTARGGAVPRGGPTARGAAAPRGDWETIYFGGGTPSLLPPAAIAELLQALPHSADPGPAARGGATPRGGPEVTLEANPEDVTDSNARAWASAGINRVSLGAQSFDDRVLQWMHRSHDAARIGEAVRALRAAGIDNISLDLIFGLPGELGRDWGRDLDMARALRTAHLSLYGLTIEPRTPLDRWISRGAVQAPEEGRYVDEYLDAHRRLTADGYQFYEVSNAALPGLHSRHNSAYWSGRPYVGLGPAAHSFDGRSRRWNLSAWEAYRRAIAEGRSPVESEEALTREQQEIEGLYLALRTSEGLPLRRLAASSADRWVREGWVTVAENRVRCTPEGWLRLDSLVSELTMYTESQQL